MATALFYRIYRGTLSGGPYLLIGQSNPNPGVLPASGIQTTYQDGPGNLINGQTYYYVIAAVSQDGESAYSLQFVATAPSQPASPTGLTAVIS